MMAAATVVAFWAASLSFAWASAGISLIWVAAFLAVSVFYRRFRTDPSITYGTECGAHLAFVFALSCMLSYPLATAGLPYRDATLHAADVWLGLDWRAYLHFVNERPHLGNLARLAYGSVLFQSILLIFCLAGPSGLVRLQQYIFATAIALAVTLTVFIFVPAGGTYAFLNVAPKEFANLAPATTAAQVILLDALRSGQHTLIAEMAGIVTFPSFHAAWAVLFMWGFYPIRWLRHGAIGLNFCVLASTPVQGAHYFIDLAGGIVVAIAAICTAARLMGDRDKALPERPGALPRSTSYEIATPARSLGGACL